MNTKRSAIIFLAIATVGLLAGCGGSTRPAADTPKSQAYKYGGFEWGLIDPAGYVGSMFLGTDLGGTDAQNHESPSQRCTNNAQYMHDTYGDSDFAGFGTLNTPAQIADFTEGCEDAAMATGNYTSLDSGPLTLPPTPADNLTTAPAPVTTTAAAPPAVTVTAEARTSTKAATSSEAQMSNGCDEQWSTLTGEECAAAGYLWGGDPSYVNGEHDGTGMYATVPDGTCTLGEHLPDSTISCVQGSSGPHWHGQ